MTLAELLVDQALQGRTVEIGGQAGFAPDLVHVSITDIDGRTVGFGDCIRNDHHLHQLVQQTVDMLDGRTVVEGE